MNFQPPDPICRHCGDTCGGGCEQAREERADELRVSEMRTRGKLATACETIMKCVIELEKPEGEHGRQDAKTVAARLRAVVMSAT